jgi:hypothetical protein
LTPLGLAENVPIRNAHAREAPHKLLLDVAGATMVVSIRQASDLTGPEHHWVLCNA